MIALHRLIIGLCLGVFSGWMFADYFELWGNKIKSHYVWNEVDLYWSVVCLIPILLGHFVTIWGNYFRASSQFQNSISKVTTPASKKQSVSFWERHDSQFGYSIKFWCLTGSIVIMNIYWFVLTTILRGEKYVTSYGLSAGASRAIAYGASQAILLDTSIILFLVLRRSMLHAIGFTYPEIIPLHRWLGVTMLVWATIHAIFYIIFLDLTGTLSTDIAFTGIGRGTRDMPGVFAWCGLIIMAFFALPQFRRMVYPIFLYVHRAGTFVFFIGLIMHYPSVMLWYYMLPGFVLFLIDRFVPKIIQARSISPVATCTLNADADIIRVRFTSPEPMKPYYPGDYITVHIPGMGHIYHPFTIASYWPEDPYSITLYMRVLGESKYSWTRHLAQRCGTDDKSITIRANVDGVFGDRRHDYLKSETMIMFVAGAAITTFMALIKAIAAQIAASNEPLRVKLHFICTFRTRSELHAYGSFLHQITRDPRFTSWLHVEIYVSRPDKPQTLMGAHAHVVKNDIQIPAQTKKKSKNILKRTGTLLSRALSELTMVDVPTAAMDPTANKGSNDSSKEKEAESATMQRSNSGVSTTNTLKEIDNSSKSDEASMKGSSSSPTSLSLSGLLPVSENPTRTMTYQEHTLPTFQDSSADSISKKLAALDLMTSALLVAVPLAVYYGMRAVDWEGPSQWCVTTNKKDGWTIFVCQWTYAMVPGVLHTIVMLALGYIGIRVARKVHMRHHMLRAGSRDIESSAASGSSGLSVENEKQSVTDGNWDEGDVVYSHGRMDVRKIIKSFVDEGVGKKRDGRGLTTVFAGGPEGFLNMVDKQVQKANWTVEFHRETWAP